jgi:serine/threonine protein kinase
VTPSPLRTSDPQHVGAYRLLGRLGEGGMGAVYLAEDQNRRRVAVKVIRPELARDPEFRARFRSEVKRARQVPPFCTAEVLDADADHATPYLVVEYVDGPSLADLIRDRGPLCGGNLHSLAMGVAIALAAIHDAGVVHRDLKPANVLLSPGTPKVIDFGIAKALDTTSQHTVPGQILGTIAYMGPERFDTATAATAGPATDVFSWGAVVAYAATGHTPFTPESLIATAAGVALPTPDLSGVPAPLRDLVARALRQHPDERPSAHDLLDALFTARYAGDSGVRADLEHRPELQRAAAAVRRTMRHPTPTGGTASTPIRNGLATLVQTRGPWRRWTPPSTVASVAGLALVAGLTLYPVTENLATRNPGNRPSQTPAQSPSERRDNDPASRGGIRGVCSLDGPLEATSRQPKAFTCPASRTPARQSIHAKVKFGTTAGCAAIWTHVADTKSYRITVCTEHISLDIETHGREKNIGYLWLDPPADPATWHTVEVLTPGTGITVTLDGEHTLNKRRIQPTLTRGTVVLGVAAAHNRGTAPTVTPVAFADVTVTSEP